MRMVEMKHEGLEGSALFPETAVAHWERAGWTVVEPDAGEFAPPENRPPAEPASPAPVVPSEQSDAAVASNPESSPEASQITRRRPTPRPEGSA